MNNFTPRPAIANLALLLFVALPLALMTILLGDVLTGRQRTIQLAQALESGAMYWLVYAPGLAAGGVLHQLLVTWFRKRFSTRRPRLVAILFIPVIPSTLVLFGQNPVVLWWYAVPTAVLLMVYVFSMRLGPADSTSY